MHDSVHEPFCFIHRLVLQAQIRFIVFKAHSLGDVVKIPLIRGGLQQVTQSLPEILISSGLTAFRFPTSVTVPRLAWNIVFVLINIKFIVVTRDCGKPFNLPKIPGLAHSNFAADIKDATRIKAQ